MIVEHEVIEQLEEEDLGRPFPWVCDLIRSLGSERPLTVLQGMWRKGHVALVSAEGLVLPRWRCEEILLRGGEGDAVQVAATSAGSTWVRDS